jgi:hypothetical protein
MWRPRPAETAFSSFRNVALAFMPAHRASGLFAIAPPQLFARVLLRAQKVQRDVRRIADHPTVMARRPGRNVEHRAGAQFVDRPITRTGDNFRIANDPSRIVLFASCR